MSLEVLKGWAEAACKDLGGKPENWIAIATQWTQEKGFYWWEKGGESPYNVGNTRELDGKFQTFKDLNEGVWGYIHFLENDPAEYYVGVLHALRKGTPDEVIKALSQCPYCSPPYPFGELESLLDHMEITFGLQTVTVPQPKPPMVPPVVEGSQIEESKESAAQESVEDGHEYVTVAAYPSKFGSLWGIAEVYCGGGANWRELLPLNPGLLANHLQIGQKVRVK